MGLSKVAFVNAALDHLGKDNIASLGESSTAARKANAIVDRVLISTLERAPWSFNRKFQLLSSLTNDWEERWAFKYDRPNDMAKFIRLVPPIDLPDADPIPVGHKGGAIYANLDVAKVEYVVMSTETGSMPQYFLDAAAFLLARDLAMPLTRKVSFWDTLDQRFEFQLSRASEIDAAQEPSTYISSNDYIAVRGGGEVSPYDSIGADGSSYWSR